jgi:hypothetical protein
MEDREIGVFLQVGTGFSSSIASTQAYVPFAAYSGVLPRSITDRPWSLLFRLRQVPKLEFLDLYLLSQYIFMV